MNIDRIKQYNDFIKWVTDPDNYLSYVSDPRNYKFYITPYSLEKLINLYGGRRIREAVETIDNRLDLHEKCLSFAFQIDLIAKWLWDNE